jgi:hypothetical protein
VVTVQFIDGQGRARPADRSGRRNVVRTFGLLLAVLAALALWLQAPGETDSENRPAAGRVEPALLRMQLPGSGEVAPAGRVPSPVASAALDRLRLLGIVRGGSGQRAMTFALIDSGSGTGMFGVGDEVRSGRRVVAIGADRVEIADAAGGSTTLQLDAAVAAPGAAVATAPQPAAAARQVVAVEKLPRVAAYGADGLAIEPAEDAN